ncbi:MAG: hypothetical protein JXB00_01835 [Bacteroidales bacterium]|nr:hypothetical protein [Bacteroidales bacterium]
MKIFNLTSWIAGIIAGVLVLLAFIALIFKVELLGVRHVYNYFHVANSLLLIAILCSIRYYKSTEK